MGGIRPPQGRRMLSDLGLISLIEIKRLNLYHRPDILPSAPLSQWFSPQKVEPALQ